MAWLLLEEGRHLGMEEPDGCVEQREEALAAVDELAASLGAEAARELRGARARGHAYLAEAHTVSESHVEAWEALEKARELAPQGEDTELEATLLEVEALLRRAAGETEEGIELLQRAAERLEGPELAPRRAEAWVALGKALTDSGEPERGMELLRKAERFLQGAEYPVLLLNALHNLAVAELRQERYDAVRRTIAGAEELYERWADPQLRAKRTWLLGKASTYSGELEAAKAELLAARELFLDAGEGLAAVRVMMELARVYALRGKFAEVAHLDRTLLALSRRPEVRELVLADFRELRDGLWERGLPARGLSGTIAALEAMEGSGTEQ